MLVILAILKLLVARQSLTSQINKSASTLEKSASLEGVLLYMLTKMILAKEDIQIARQLDMLVHDSLVV